ncbi:fluoride efflux transporter CrcB [Ureibacillus massiliensis]|nr:fluoride efflux transporter CrcB [Ureibacillus massiliensis]
MVWLMVMVGGGIGATLRYFVTSLMKIQDYPNNWATIVVNLLGSFLLGISAHLAFLENVFLAFLTVGVLGAFTTFSTFAFDIVKLIDQKRFWNAILFIFLNLIGGLILFSLGYLIRF